MKTLKLRFLTKGELEVANKRAIKANCGRSIEPEYIERLPDDKRYPVYFTLPWERHGWVRCQIGTSVSGTAEDCVPLWLDVPKKMFDGLRIIAIPDDGENDTDMA